MKDFQEFKETLSKEVLDKWNEEVCATVNEKLEPIRESNPESYFSSRPTMYAFHLSMRLLEAYHDWLNQ